MLVVVLSAAIAIMFTGYAETVNTRERYCALLESIRTQICSEELYLSGSVYVTHEAEDNDDESVMIFDSLLKQYDMSALLDNVISTNEAALTLSPKIYSNILHEMNYRDIILEAIDTKDYNIFGDHLGCLTELDVADQRLLFLIDGQIACLKKSGDENQIIKEYLDTYYNTTEEE